MRAPPKTPKRTPRMINVDARAEAMRLLAEGMAVGDVAREVRRDRSRIRMWRDTPEGQRLLSEARARRAEEFKSAADNARTLLREHAVKAVQALVDDLRLPGRRGRAARDILDRVGVLRGHEVFFREPLDLSKLSAEELAAMETMVRKAKQG